MSGTYIHQLKQWPAFKWDNDSIAARLAKVSHQQGRLLGRMEALGFKLREEATLHTLTEDVIKSSEIEGEILDKEQVRSSIARRLGLDIGALTPADRNVEGIVEMMLDATQQYDKPLSEERLFGWHAALFPTGWSGLNKITVGAWRTEQSGPMQVVSGPMGRERVHYEAPAADHLKREMKQFLAWFNKKNDLDLILKAAIAHLWFVTIHPFEDGNGRIARAISDLVLARSERTRQRFYSMSAQIRHERNAYYDILEATQKGDLDITAWLQWFLDCLAHAFDGADVILAAVLKKAGFWKRHTGESFNDRQRLILNRMLNGFEGKLTSSKWAKLAKCSQDTASRDIDDLVQRGVLIKDPGRGRSTSYSLIAATNDVLRQVAEYARHNSQFFVRTGARALSPQEVAEKRTQVLKVAHQIEALGRNDEKGDAAYRKFDALLNELRQIGFSFPNELVSLAAHEFLSKPR